MMEGEENEHGWTGFGMDSRQERNATMLRLKASHGTVRRWAQEFNAVGVIAKCLNRLTGK